MVSYSIKCGMLGFYFHLRPKNIPISISEMSISMSGTIYILGPQSKSSSLLCTSGNTALNSIPAENLFLFPSAILLP